MRSKETWMRSRNTKPKPRNGKPKSRNVRLIFRDACLKSNKSRIRDAWRTMAFWKKKVQKENKRDLVQLLIWHDTMICAAVRWRSLYTSPIFYVPSKKQKTKKIQAFLFSTKLLNVYTIVTKCRALIHLERIQPFVCSNLKIVSPFSTFVNLTPACVGPWDSLVRPNQRPQPDKLDLRMYLAPNSDHITSSL